MFCFSSAIFSVLCFLSVESNSFLNLNIMNSVLSSSPLITFYDKYFLKTISFNYVKILSFNYVRISTTYSELNQFRSFIIYISVHTINHIYSLLLLLFYSYSMFYSFIYHQRSFLDLYYQPISFNLIFLIYFSSILKLMREIYS